MKVYLIIKEIAKKKKITYKEIADALNVTDIQVTNYLNGRSKIIADQIPVLANLLKVSISQLYGVANEIKSKNDIDPCLECLKKQLEIDELKNKNIELNEKYIACLEELLGKKGNSVKNSA